MGRRDRPGSAPSPPRPPQHLLCSLIAPALWASEPSFWGYVPQMSHMCCSGAPSYPQFFFYVLPST